MKLPLLVITVSIMLVGCVGSQSKSEPSSVKDSRQVFSKTKRISAELIDASQHCKRALQTRQEDWALECINANDQRMKLLMMDSNYLNAGSRLSGWSLELLQSSGGFRRSRIRSSDDIRSLIEETQYFKDKAENEYNHLSMPRCLKTIYSVQSSLVQQNCCQYLEQILDKDIWLKGACN